jgi:hypothetical protein
VINLAEVLHTDSGVSSERCRVADKLLRVLSRRCRHCGGERVELAEKKGQASRRYASLFAVAESQAS